MVLSGSWVSCINPGSYVFPFLLTSGIYCLNLYNNQLLFIYFFSFFNSAVSFYIWRHLFNHKKQPKKEKNMKRRNHALDMSKIIFPVARESRAGSLLVFDGTAISLFSFSWGPFLDQQHVSFLLML